MIARSWLTIAARAQTREPCRLPSTPCLGWGYLLQNTLLSSLHFIWVPNLIRNFFYFRPVLYRRCTRISCWLHWNRKLPRFTAGSSGNTSWFRKVRRPSRPSPLRTPQPTAPPRRTLVSWIESRMISKPVRNTRALRNKITLWWSVSYVHFLKRVWMFTEIWCFEFVDCMHTVPVLWKHTPVGPTFSKHKMKYVTKRF